MKRLLPILLSLCLSLSASGLYAMRAGGSVQTYNERSVLASGRWVRIAVSRTGVHQLTTAQLQQMGFQGTANVHLYGYGGRMLEEDFNRLLPRMDDLQEVPAYRDGGRMLFYAVATDTETFNPVDASSEVCGYWDYNTNPYSAKGYYFLTENDQPGLSLPLQEVPDRAPTVEINRTLQVAHLEEEKINLLGSGRLWLGDEFNGTTPSHSYTFRFNHPVAGSTVFAYIRAVGSSTVGSGSHLYVNINGTAHSTYFTIPALSGDYTALYANPNYPLTFPMPGSGQLNLQLSYDHPNAASKAWTDRITVTALTQLTMQGSWMRICYPSYYYQSNDVARYTLSDAGSATQIWDITRSSHPSRMGTTLNGSTLTFNAPYDQLHEYVAVNTAGKDFLQPEFVAEVPNQNLHGLNGTDLVILTPEAYRNASERLARHHQAHDGLQVVVVTPQQVYNEFSSGTPDITAYRLFMKMLYDRCDGTNPPALMLMGATSYDNRGITTPATGLLSYQSVESLDANRSITTDDYLGLLDDTDGAYLSQDKMDIAVGHVPATTVNEANQYVDKVIDYTTGDNPGDWRNRFVFMGDDGDSDENIHATQANKLADTLLLRHPEYQPIRIYQDAFPLQQSATGGSYPEARKKMLDELKAGCLVFTYVGHSSPNTISHEQTFTLADVPDFHPKYPAFWITASCEMSRSDDGRRSIGTALCNSPDGAIALVSAVRQVYSDGNFALVKYLYRRLFPENGAPAPTIGEALRAAKNTFNYADFNKLNFKLLGDPVLRLRHPKQEIITDSINGQLPEDALMQALGLVTINGHVDDGSGAVDTEFNGPLQITVYDKKETLQTLGNRDFKPFVYQDYPNVIFSGRTLVKDGRFSSTFMVPKDISYRYDQGRIVYYAQDADRDTDAHGSNQAFSIGGSDPDAQPSTEGPDARIYINTPSFKNGQVVDNTPVFYAHTYDASGINTVGAGIGHDIVLKLNNSKQMTYVLNDYYESTLNDYKSGRIVYELPELAEGDYTLTFKVWNLQNISTTQKLFFRVDNQAKPDIERFSVYPNPASGPVTIVYRHDRPMEPVEATFTIYDVTGRPCWQETASQVTDDGTVSVTWDLKDNQGRHMSSGIYPVMLKITTKAGNFQTKTQKIILVTQ